MSENNNNGGKYFWLGMIFIMLCGFIFFVGWVFAHNVIAEECARLNSFYVGNTVYECKART